MVSRKAGNAERLPEVCPVLVSTYFIPSQRTTLSTASKITSKLAYMSGCTRLLSKPMIAPSQYPVTSHQSPAATIDTREHFIANNLLIFTTDAINM